MHIERSFICRNPFGEFTSHIARPQIEVVP